MKIKPIFDIKDYFFPLFFVKHNFDYVSSEDYIEPELNVSAHIWKPGDDRSVITVMIETRNDIPKESLPFEFTIHVSGIIEHFGTPDGLDPLVYKKLLYVNGASLLYSAARDRLSIFCKNPLYDVFYLLPTHRFNPEDINDDMDIPKDEKTTRGKRKRTKTKKIANTQTPENKNVPPVV